MNPSDDEPDRAASAEDRARAASEPVEVVTAVDRIVHGDREERKAAFETYERLVADRSDALDDAAVALESHLTADSAETRYRAARTAEVLLERDPGGFHAVVPALRSLAGDPAEPAREPAVLALAALALERPADAAAATDVLCRMAGARLEEPAAHGSRGSTTTGPRDPTVRDNPERDRRDHVRVRAMAGLTRIAAEKPAAVRDHAPAVGALLTDDHHLVRGGACEVLESLAAPVPDAVEPFAPALAERLEADAKHPVPRRAAAALDALAASSPERVGDDVAAVAPSIEPLLEASDPDVRRTGASLLSHAAKREPERVERYVPALRGRLADDPDERVRELSEGVLEVLERDDGTTTRRTTGGSDDA